MELQNSGRLLPVARGWSTSRASGPVTTMLAHKVANPIIVMDELDKAAWEKLKPKQFKWISYGFPFIYDEWWDVF